MAIGYNYEDTYLLNKQPVLDTDENGPSSGNEVIIACKTKNTRISGYISEGIKINGKAKWKEMFGGGISAMTKGLLQTGSNITQLVEGHTIQQPWMNRKFYESTEPFSFTFGINFVSQGNAEEEVYLPASYLLSLIYPREWGSNVAGDLLLKGTKNGKQKGFIGRDTLAGTLINSMTDMVIPGPSLCYTGKENPSKKQDVGDAVTITIGQMFAFGGVYLENIGVEFSSSFDTEGFPLYAKCSVTATCMDVNYCNTDGSFLISQYGPGQCEKISNFTQKLKEVMIKTAEDVGDVVDRGKEFYGYFFHKNN